MKFNFKKITSVLASAIMLGSTIGIAAAAGTYPSPFIKGGTADVAVVVGTTAQSSDYLAAVNLGQSLQTELAKQTATAGAGTGASAAGGDSIQISKSSDKLNLGNGLQDVWGTAITNSDLKTVLADGKFYNKQNTEYKYNQKIDLGNLSFAHFSDSDYKDRLPTLGFQLSANTYVANYTLDFITDPEATHGTDLTDFENKNIGILGKSYYILDFKNSTAKLTLLDSANTAVLAEGETKTVTVGDKSYEVSISFISDAKVILTVNGENTDSMSETGTTYGNTYKLSDGTYIGVKSLNVQNYAGGAKNVEFSIGKGKLEITDGSNIKINDKTITDLYGYITLSATSSKRTWQKLVMKWQIEDEAFLTPGKELTMPGFEAIKFTMADTTIPAKGTTKLTASNEALELKTTIKKGEDTIPLLYIHTTTGNITGIGKSATQKLATSNTAELIYNATSSSVSQYEGFVASWASSRDAESYYLKASVRYDSDGVRNLTTITDKITADILCEDLVAAQTCTIGNVVLTINKVDYTSGGDRLVNMTINTAGGFNNLYTKDGLRIYLPYDQLGQNTTTKGALNLLTANSTYADDGYHVGKWILWMGEENKDGTLDSVPFNFTVDDSGTSTKYITVNEVYGDGTAYETPTSGSKIWESYVVSELATKILHDKTGTNQYSAEVEYHGSEVYANVFVAAPAVTVSGGGTTAGTGTVTELGSVTVKDSEISSVQTKNLIVVGGSCINTVAAKLLGSDTPLCGAAFTTATGVGADQFLIKVIESPYTAGKVAMLVAGYEAADTTKAVTYVTKEPNVVTDKDTTVKKVTATYADVTTAATA